MSSRRLTMSVAIGATAVALGGGAYGLINATAGNGSGTTTTATSPSARSGRPVPGSGSNARSGPAAGGATGTVDSVSKSRFTLSTSADQKVTVKASSTTYRKGTSSISASAIERGQSVLVLGTTNGTTITAT